MRRRATVDCCNRTVDQMCGGTPKATQNDTMDGGTHDGSGISVDGAAAVDNTTGKPLALSRSLSDISTDVPPPEDVAVDRGR